MSWCDLKCLKPCSETAWRNLLNFAKLVQLFSVRHNRILRLRSRTQQPSKVSYQAALCGCHMGLQGYVGSGEDVRRIRRQEQQLEEERKKREAEKQQRDANVSAAGFRQFGKGAAEVNA